jgi:DNA-binding NarL/FixJ family response regulator
MIELHPRATGQREVVKLLLAGYYETAEIARLMGVKKRTVKSHFSKLFERVGIPVDSKNKRVRLLNVIMETEHLQWYGKQPTQREWEFIREIAAGKTGSEIAAALGVTAQSSRERAKGIYDKLGVWGRAELAIWFKTYGPGPRRKG